MFMIMATYHAGVWLVWTN